MRYQAVLFDLGNTLLDYGLHGQWRAFLRQRMEEVYELVCHGAAGQEVAPSVFVEQVAEVFGGERTRELKHAGRSLPFGEMLREAMRGLQMECAEEHVTRVIEEFYRPIREHTTPYPDTVETLEWVKGAGLKMAIISNTPWDAPGYLTHGDLQKWALEGYFEATVYSGDVPWRKPHPEFMWEAARRLGVEREACVVVGNDLASDIGGANAAGMRSIWVDRDRTTGPEPWATADPDAVVEGLTEVTRTIREWMDG